MSSLRRFPSATAVVVGAILLVAAVVGFVVVPEHTPGTQLVDAQGHPLAGCDPGACAGTNVVHIGWAQTTYDVARVFTWAVLIVGALVVVLGLIRQIADHIQKGRDT
jgi:hypothetical protein